MPLRLARFLAVSLAALLAALPALAQQDPYPARPIRFFVGYPPGGSTDTAARILAAKLSERVGQSVIVDNRSGAGGLIGIDAVAKSEPDGYTIGFGVSGNLAVNVTLLPKMPFDPLKDLAPVSMAVNNSLIIVAHPSLPANNVAELIALAKAKPGKLLYGAPGTGSAMHLAGALLNTMAGIELSVAHYKGLGPVANDLVGGHIPLAILDVTTTRGFIEQGRLKALATTAARRTPTAANVPTVAESGVPGYAVTSWFGVIAPARTPPERIRFLNAHIVAILESPEVRERYLAAGLEPAASTPEEFGQFIRVEVARWAKVIKEAGIVAQQ